MFVTPTVSLRRRALRPALAAAMGIVAVALLGQWGTDLGPWYRSLKLPAWQPPDAWFGPAWMLIYLSTGTAAVLAWLAADRGRERGRLLAAYALNAALNIAWSWLFFRLRRPDWALAEVALLWLSIVLLMLLSARHSAAAAWLLLPYLLWVAFAASLNWGVVRLNAPF